MVKPTHIYSKIDVQGKVSGASPNRLIQLLYENALEHMRKAELFCGRDDGNAKALFNQHLIQTINTLMGLRESLDFEADDDLPHQLDGLYDYLQRRLIVARIKSDVAIVGECIALVETLKSGWDALCQ